MCSHYEAPSPGQLALAFGVEPIEQAKLDLWPGYFGPFVRGVANRDDPEDFDSMREVLSGSFGLIPGWSKDTKIARRCYNARSETAAVKPSFRNAWKNGQHCIIPAAAIYEPDWRSGKAIATRITRSDGEPMGIAGLWERWKSPSGQEVFSYSMLTINADQHPFMRNYHRAGDEKRMVVILAKGLYHDWLNTSASESMEFMREHGVHAGVSGRSYDSGVNRVGGGFTSAVLSHHHTYGSVYGGSGYAIKPVYRIQYRNHPESIP